MKPGPHDRAFSFAALGLKTQLLFIPIFNGSSDGSNDA
jgi:hypothetical protein